MNYKEMKEIVSNDKYFLRWIDGVSKGTNQQYLYALTDICSATSKTPSEISEICKKDYTKPPWEREINDWFIEFDHYCEIKKFSKETYRKRKTNVKGFFRFNQIETPIPRRGNKKNYHRANDRKLPTKEDLKLLLDACNTIKQKAIILIQFSSGLSNSDVVKLTVGNFREGLLDEGICKIRLRRHKNENELITFLSPEAVQATQTYLRVERDDPKDSQPLFTKYNSPTNSMTSHTIIHIYSRLCDNLGWEKEGNAFRKITGHMGRKWIKTNLTNAGMPREPLETLLGHKLQRGTDDNYYMINEDALTSIYLKYLPSITINPTKTLTLESKEFSELQKQLQENKKAFIQKDQEMKTMKEELKNLKDIFEMILDPKTNNTPEFMKDRRDVMDYINKNKDKILK